MTDKPYSDACVSLVMAMEGLRLTPYRDQGGVWTVGYGHTGEDVIPGDEWTKDDADRTLELDLDTRARQLQGMLINPAALSRNQFGALLSLGFNIGMYELGASTALSAVLLDNLPDVPKYIRLWNKVTIDGCEVTDKGLIGRRAAECALWSLPDSAEAPWPDWPAIAAAAEAG
jgi:lysozyme